MFDEPITFVAHPFLTDTPEWRALKHAELLGRLEARFMIHDDPGDPSIPFEAVPVGSIEFCSVLASARGIVLEDLDYPRALHSFLHRLVYRTTLGEILYNNGEHRFVKPVRTKAFEAMATTDPRLSTHLGSRPDPHNDPVWASEIVEWIHEWRVYVLHGEVIGQAQYDDESDDRLLTSSEMNVVDALITSYGDVAPVSYALDVGTLDDGRLALIEVNDAWGTGYYPWGTLDKALYGQWLARRWWELLGDE